MNNFSLILAPYKTIIKEWPLNGNHILAQFDDLNIIVYQAYNQKLAESIIQSQSFHSDLSIKNGFNMNRMSWIKTNFLWMMYRSGWASKENQERVLAIKIKRTGFEELLRKAVIASKNSPINLENNRSADQVRLQWDPDHNPDGSKVTSGRRAIQLGLRGDMLLKFSNEFITEISDITEFVIEQSKNISDESKLLLPLETIYKISDSNIKNNINLSDFDQN